MAKTLQDFTVAILVVDGFEQVELTGPRDALHAEGARTVIVSAKRGPVSSTCSKPSVTRKATRLPFNCALIIFSSC